MNKCIWCKQEVGKQNLEHIIPEAIGCPENFHLVGCICERCNNNLGHLDQAVIDDFDMLAFMAGVPRKKNRPPQVSSRGNLVAKHTNEGPTILINMENHPIQGKHGTHLGRFGNSKRNVKAEFEVDGPLAHIRFKTSIGENPKFVRGIYKIAFASLAYFIGANKTLDDKYDPIREFVLKGKGNRNLIFIPCEDTEYKHEVWPPYKLEAKEEYVITLRLARIEFTVDLTSNMSIFPQLLSQLKDLGIGNLSNVLLNSKI